MIDPELFAETRRRVAYNAHDLGEFGTMIRLEYVYNILADLQVALDKKPVT